MQPKLSVGNEGKVLIDATNLKNSNSKSRKRKSENIENFQPKKVTRKDGIYSDPPTNNMSKFTEHGTQTDSTEPDSPSKCEQKIKNMLTDDEPSSEYWEAVAEERRKALAETLEENKVLREENEFLKEENKVLEEMLQEAKQLATLVQEITNSTEEKEGNGTETDEPIEEKDSVTIENSSSGM